MAFGPANAPQRERRGLWDQLVDCICRPPRDYYSLNELIGGTRGKFTIDQRRFRREDLVLTNKHGQKLQCSHYKLRGPAEQRPCVIYAHCNSGSRRDAEEALYVLLPHNITIFCLDFAGSGLSDGEWVTLGAHEVDDIAAAVEHLRVMGQTSTIGLWGRSMGAVTAMAYARQDPSISGIVVDSPFSRLTDLMTELVVEQKLPIPRPFMRVALSMMRRSVRKRAHFSIDDVAPLDYVGETFVPVLFGHATEDTFVGKHHSERLVAAYAGDKNFITFRGDHNSVRPNFFYASVLIFFHNVLQCEDELPDVPAPRPARPPVRNQLSRQSLGITDSDASSLSISFTAPSALSAAAAAAEAGAPSPTAASASSGGSPVAHLPQREAELGNVLDPVVAARMNPFRRGSLASESATSDGGSSVRSLGRAHAPAAPAPAAPLDGSASRWSQSRNSPDLDAANPPPLASTPAAGDEDAELQLALEASLQQQWPQPAPPSSPPPAGRPPQQPQSPQQLSERVLQRLPAQTGAGPPMEAVSADLGISVEEVEASMVAAAIQLSLQEARSSSPAAQPQQLGPTGPASLKMVAAAAHYQRSRSGGSSGSSGSPPLPRPRIPFRSKSAGTASPLGRSKSPAPGAADTGDVTSPAAGQDSGLVAVARELPPIVGHMAGSLRVSPSSPAGDSPSSSGSGGGVEQGSPFAPTFARSHPAADAAAGALPAKASADVRHGSGSGGGSSRMQPGDHVGLTHVELGPVGGRQQDAGGASFASGWTAGGGGTAALAGAAEGLTSAEPRWGDFGSSLDSATTNANSWVMVDQQQPQATALARRSGSNSSSDDANGQTAALPAPQQERRPWWGGDRAASMRRLPSDTAALPAEPVASGQLGISRSERPAAERAGLQRSVFGSADGLTFYKSLGTPDDQRRTGSDGGGDGPSDPQPDAPWQPAACGDRRYRHSTSAPSAASSARSSGSGSRRGSGDGAGEAESPDRPTRPTMRWRRKPLPAATPAAQTEVCSQPAADGSG